MSQFKWTPEVGDRIITSDGTKAIVMPDGSMKGYTVSNFCYYCERDKVIKQHFPDWHNAKPRGKTRAKVKYMRKSFDYNQKLDSHLAKGAKITVGPALDDAAWLSDEHIGKPDIQAVQPLFHKGQILTHRINVFCSDIPRSDQPTTKKVRYMRPSKAYPDDFSVVANVNNGLDVLEVSNESLTAFKDPVKTVFDLVEGANCFVLNMNGSIGVHIWSERNENLTNFAIRGLVFLTRKEAEQADNQRIKDTLGAEL